MYTGNAAIDMIDPTVVHINTRPYFHMCVYYSLICTSVEDQNTSRDVVLFLNKKKVEYKSSTVRVPSCIYGQARPPLHRTYLYLLAVTQH